MDDKKPWLVPGVPWKSEAAFWSWVRGVLRKGWSKHPVKLEYIKQNRKRIINPKPSTRFPTVWGMTCAICQKDHVQTNIEIDHIAETGCKFTGLEEIKDYARHLFLVDFSSLRALCIPCHKIVSHAQNTGTSFEEAALQKRVIDFCKQDKQLVIEFLMSKGFTLADVSNGGKRKICVEEELRKEL